MRKTFNARKIYIWLFALLYICVGLVSTIHAVSFFSLANVTALGVVLACAFEIGQAAVLFSILTDIRKRRQVMPWLLMSVLTIVQILGNVYASYRYLITNSVENLRFFKEPIFVWTNIPDANANVILTYIIGAVLPIISLLMTGMLTSYLDVSATKDIEEGEPNPEEKPEDEGFEIEEERVEEPEEEPIEEAEYIDPQQVFEEQEPETKEVPMIEHVEQPVEKRDSHTINL